MAELIRNAQVTQDIVQVGAIETIPAPVDDKESNAVQQDIEAAYDKGFSDGFATANVKHAGQIKSLSTLLHSIPEAINKNRLSLSTEIADIVLAIVQRLFINQQQNKELIIHQVTQTLAQLNHKQKIDIALHPQDIALLQQGEINIDFKPYKQIKIIPDETLRLGGCVVRSEHGVFDAGIERQIDNLKAVLMKMKS